MMREDQLTRGHLQRTFQLCSPCSWSSQRQGRTEIKMQNLEKVRSKEREKVKVKTSNKKSEK